MVAIFKLAKKTGLRIVCFGLVMSGGGCAHHRTNPYPDLPIAYVFKPELRTLNKNLILKASKPENAIDALVGGDVGYRLTAQYSFSEGLKIDDYERIAKILPILPKPHSMSGNPTYCGYAAYLYIGPPLSQAYKLFNNNTMIRCNFELNDNSIIFAQPNTNLNNDLIGHCKNNSFSDLLNITIE
jgi:hypothetical protein